MQESAGGLGGGAVAGAAQGGGALRAGLAGEVMALRRALPRRAAPAVS